MRNPSARHDPLDELGLPPRGASSSEKIEWANERLWDFAEGKLSLDAFKVLWQMVVGWMDLASPDDRARYKELSRRIQDMIRSADEEG